MADRPFLGLPQACEATAIILDNAARQLRALAQSIVRPDLDPKLQEPVARKACTLASESLQAVVERMSDKPKRQPTKKGSSR